MPTQVNSEELTAIIRSCFMDSVDQNGNLVKVIDEERLFIVYLEMINSLSDRLAALQQRLEKIEDGKIAVLVDAVIDRYERYKNAEKECHKEVI